MWKHGLKGSCALGFIVNPKTDFNLDIRKRKCKEKKKKLLPASRMAYLESQLKFRN